MSTTSTTLDVPTTGDQPDDDRRPATERTTTAGDRLWAALHARPGGTADELSGDAGIGRSTAGKILARWVADGTAARVPTDGGRSASRFAVPASVDAATPDGTADAAPDPDDPPTGPTPGDGTATVDATGPGPGADRDGISTPDDASTAPPEPAGTAALTDEDAVPTPAGDAPAGADSDAEADSDSAAEGAAEAPLSGAPDTVDDPTEGTAPGGGAAPEVTAAVRGPRLAPGALHGMVEDYLRDHPEEEFGPTKLGHDLSRSTGAVANALERLVTAGYAVRTKDRPKRYALAPVVSSDDRAAPGTTAGADT